MSNASMVDIVGLDRYLDNKNICRLFLILNLSIYWVMRTNGLNKNIGG